LQRLPPGAAVLQAQSPGHLLATRDNAPLGAPGRSQVLQDGFFYALLYKT